MGGLPVMEVSSPLGRRRLVSLPFTDHCPPLVEDRANPVRFGEAIVRWQEAHRDMSLEVRAELPTDDGRARVVGTRHVLALEPEPSALFRRLDRNQIRRRVRRAREFGIEAVLGHSPAELAAFYRLHCETRRRQGVPVQPRRFVENLWRRLIEPGLGFVVTARLGGTPIATAVFLAWNQTVIYKYSASDSTRWNLGANFLVQWTAIEWACEHGYRLYDMGRTDAGHESLRAYKAGWGATEVPLVYSHVGRQTPKLTEGHASAVLAVVIRHSPTAICRALGEVLYRYAA